MCVCVIFKHHLFSVHLKYLTLLVSVISLILCMFAIFIINKNRQPHSPVLDCSVGAIAGTGGTR